MQYSVDRQCGDFSLFAVIMSSGPYSNNISSLKTVMNMFLFLKLILSLSLDSCSTHTILPTYIIIIIWVPI